MLATTEVAALSRQGSHQCRLQSATSAACAAPFIQECGVAAAGLELLRAALRGGPGAGLLQSAATGVSREPCSVSGLVYTRAPMSPPRPFPQPRKGGFGSQPQHPEVVSELVALAQAHSTRRAIWTAHVTSPPPKKTRKPEQDWLLRVLEMSARLKR